jgi:hypothetical protein
VPEHILVMHVLAGASGAPDGSHVNVKVRQRKCRWSRFRKMPAPA